MINNKCNSNNNKCNNSNNNKFFQLMFIFIKNYFLCFIADLHATLCISVLLNSFLLQLISHLYCKLDQSCASSFTAFAFSFWIVQEYLCPESISILHTGNRQDNSMVHLSAVPQWKAETLISMRTKFQVIWPHFRSCGGYLFCI